MYYTVTFLFVAIVCYLFLYKPLEETNKRIKSTLDFYQETYLQKQGSTTMFGDNGFHNPPFQYDLRSWDGGKNWYAVNYDFATRELKVLGEVETIYPGFMKHLDHWDKLTKHVSKNGPLNPTNPVDREVMECAGFTVKNK